MKIRRVNVIKNSKTGQCKGYGFVEFDRYDEAHFAVNTMNGFVYHNRPLQVSFKSSQKLIENFADMKLSDTIIGTNNNNNNNNNNVTTTPASSSTLT